ncbi:phosphatase PAP2 family protein [Saccharomonospora sp. NPDC046836]|uniref:phosphatase PAP2 family protein n=1 Tax=Saccharomonospora sp. NPDC046836 TaxID=3156921 RepID=UPI0034035C6E
MSPRNALPLAALCLLLAIVPGLLFAGERTPTALDRAAANAVEALSGGDRGLLTVQVLPSEPAVVVSAIAVIVLVALVRRRWDAAALAAAAPALAVTVNTWVLKPLFRRYYDDHLAYPSGHTVGLVSVLTVLTLLSRPGAVRLTVAGVSAVLTLLAGAGMIGLNYHYGTDIAGGAAYAIALTAAVAAVVGRLLPRDGFGDRVPGQRGEPADGA